MLSTNILKQHIFALNMFIINVIFCSTLTSLQNALSFSQPTVLVTEGGAAFLVVTLNLFKGNYRR